MNYCVSPILVLLEIWPNSFSSADGKNLLLMPFQCDYIKYVSATSLKFFTRYFGDLMNRVLN